MRDVTATDATPDDLLALACSAALAGAELVRRQRADAGGDVVAKSTPTDVVTAVDKAAEREVVGRLLAARPDDGVLGEEGGARTGRSGVRWLVDPIDGTVNYLYGLPQYAVSVAAESDGEVVAGVVVNAATGETFTATRGGGAHRDAPGSAPGSAPGGVRLTGSAATDIAHALVATGFSYDARIRAEQAAVLTRVLPGVRDIRRIGAAALDLCCAAAGQVDAYFERELNPWDLAAGGLVAREAGLRVEGLHGAPPGAAMVVAAPPALFGALHDLVAG